MHRGDTDMNYTPAADVSGRESSTLPEVDAARNRFPCSIVWGALPCLSWMFPFIGHMGITDSDGRIHDFAGPYTICIDRFMVGKVLKYYPMDPNECGGRDAWDDAVAKADEVYSHKMHNLCCQNCHHHTVHALEILGIHYNIASAVALVLFKGKWSSPSAFLHILIPFLIFCVILFVSIYFTS